MSFVSGREPLLQLERDGVVEPVALDAGDGYEGEVRHLLAALSGSVVAPAPADMLADAVDVTRLIAAERESQVSGKTVVL